MNDTHDVSAATLARGVTTVYVYGTLAGIRFIDRFEIDDAGRIVDQKVWNDLGEARR